jgi:thymidylate synthase (FAD)
LILIKPSFAILSYTEDALRLIERAGRTCYEMVRERGHLSVIEHVSLTVKFIVDRGFTHELVRHRLAAYSQESTWYCNYGSKKHGGELTFVIPSWSTIRPGTYAEEHYPFPVSTGGNRWFRHMRACERCYLDLIAEEGWTPEQARSVLPNSLKTEIVMTANFREWLHVFALRCSPAAHPQMREIMAPLHDACRKDWPAVFAEL